MNKNAVGSVPYFERSGRDKRGVLELPTAYDRTISTFGRCAGALVWLYFHLSEPSIP